MEAQSVWSLAFEAGTCQNLRQMSQINSSIIISTPSQAIKDTIKKNIMVASHPHVTWLPQTKRDVSKTSGTSSSVCTILTLLTLSSLYISECLGWGSWYSKCYGRNLAFLLMFTVCRYKKNKERNEERGKRHVFRKLLTAAELNPKILPRIRASGHGRNILWLTLALRGFRRGVSLYCISMSDGADKISLHNNMLKTPGL